MIAQQVFDRLEGNWKKQNYSPFLFESYTCLSAPTDHCPHNLKLNHDLTTYSFSQFLRIDDTLVDYLVKLLNNGYRYRSLYRVYIDCGHIAPKTIRVTLYYRYTWFRYRFMLLIANQPIPMDIIRHVYTFIKQ
jgi:hypothetical protein